MRSPTKPPLRIAQIDVLAEGVLHEQFAWSNWENDLTFDT